jgi:large subunit ribosomal protein L9
MKIILNQDIKNVGLKDDVVTVKNGYGRNFLIPQGMARLATSSAMKMLEEDVRQRAFKQEKIVKDAQAIADKINGKSISVGVKAGASGKIFGSVTTLQVANEINEQLGAEVDKRRIVFSEDIKNIGSYKATINLHKEVVAEMDLEIVQD